MTHPQTTEQGVQTRTVFVDRAGAQARAEGMQRRGLTLSEIAEAMDCRRVTIVHMLYWGKVRS